MRTKILLLLCVLFAFAGSCFAQSCPPNIDFETGDFSNWECFTGSTKVNRGVNEINLTLSGPVPGRHEIISASTTASLDPYGQFPKLCPYGGAYSVKLGNDQTGSQAEGISYTFQVPASVDTFTFTYFYAVVFEDPNHSLPEQPRFFVTAYDVATGDLVSCASYNYVSDGGIPGFQQSSSRPDVLFKNWTPTSLQFAGLSGHTVRLEFKTADCTLGGHFGYAYVDVGSACSNILATAPYCQETNSLLLNAPYGFQTYTWYNSSFTTVMGNQQSLTLSPPPATSGVFYVDMIPYPGYGCRDTLQAIVTPLPVPDLPTAQDSYTFCQYQTAPFLTATATPGNIILWYTSATGGIGISSPPRPATTSPGVIIYYVSQKALFGCESFRKPVTVTIVPTPNVSFLINNIRQCQNGNDFTFTSTTTNRVNSVFSWDFGDGQTQSSAADSIVSHVYTAAGNFAVKLKVENSATCSAQKTGSVTVVPKPVASFTYPPVICEHQTPLAFVDNSSVPGGVAIINKWWWNIAGTVVQTQSPATTTAGSPGAIPVQLVVTTAEGCRSDTNTTTVNVRYRPGVAFSHSALLCDNEVIQFTDQSTMPSGATGETIVKWYWQFDNTILSAQQNPALNLTAGVHKTSLLTETNFGCKSLQLDKSLRLFAKPQIQLTISDSCVYRPIKYSGIDLLNTVDKWYWDFGAGLAQNGSSVTKTFAKEGNNPLILLAQTTEGCKDTIVRPFMIYDNKAWAGRDTVAAINEPIQLNAHGGLNVQYLWTPAIGLNNAAIENPVATLDQDQTYRLDALTDKGCDSHSQILIKRYKGPELYVPSAFTPDRDGRNDVLKVIPVGMKTFLYFAVYDRLGQLIFKTTDYNKGWDGTYKGSPMPTATFVFITQAIDYRGKPALNKGTVTLIR